MDGNTGGSAGGIPSSSYLGGWRIKYLRIIIVLAEEASKLKPTIEFRIALPSQLVNMGAGVEFANALGLPS